LTASEKGLERAVNGAFAKTFKSGLQPIEITSALRRELDTKAAVVSRDRILVPNRFTVRLSSGDYAQMTAIGPTLVDELQPTRSSMPPPSTTSSPAASASPWPKTLDSRACARHRLVSVKGTAPPDPCADVAGKRYPIVRPHDHRPPRRRHPWMTPASPANTSRSSGPAEVNDFGSTNGSRNLIGVSVHLRAFSPLDLAFITIGRTRIVFLVLAQSAQLTSSPIPCRRRCRRAVNE
jgi:hypothetical protein